LKPPPVRLALISIVAAALISFFFLRLSMNTYREEHRVVTRTLGSVPESALRSLAGSRLFFGHQSVGQDILEGMGAIIGERPAVSLNIVQSQNLSNLPRGTLAHWKIGHNTKPETKIRAFKKIMLSCTSGAVDLALMKFCYVDVTSGTDVQSLFEHYSSSIEELQRAHPETQFVHVTIPIESMPKSFRGMMATAAKKILGRPTVIDDNAARREYNELLRRRFDGREPVFDLALLEALDARGRVTVARSQRGSVQFMDRSKTSDGGHLNEVGKRFVGERFVAFLAEQVPDHR